MPKSILLVEDNPNDELLTIRALKKAGIVNEIVVARDGEEAINYLFNNKALSILPQVIILDLKLPKIDGLQVLKRIREDECTKNIPVVVLTSSKEESDLMGAYNLHTNAYVQKPVDFVKFAEACQYLGMFWLLLNETCPGPERRSADSASQTHSDV